MTFDDFRWYGSPYQPCPVRQQSPIFPTKRKIKHHWWKFAIGIVLAVEILLAIFFFKPKKWTLPEGIQIAKNFYYQTAKTITFSNSIFCSRKFCHNRKKIPLGVALQLLNPVATIFSPGLRIHGTYMVGMINGPLGFALYYIHYWLSTYTYVVESCRPPLVISSVGGQNR